MPYALEEGLEKAVAYLGAVIIQEQPGQSWWF